MAVYQPNYTLSDIERLDRRIEAHIDGLRIAGDDGRRACGEPSKWEEPGEVFVSSVLALEMGDSFCIQQKLKSLTGQRELLCGLISALGWTPFDRIESHAKWLISASPPAVQHVGIAVFAIHRKDPGEMLSNLVRSDDSLLKARALRAVGELGRMDLVPLIQADLKAKDEVSRFWAAWSIALVAGSTNAVQDLQSFVESAGSFSERALQVILRRLDIRRAHDWNLELAESQRAARMSVIGAGVIGDPVLIPWLIEKMTIPPLSRVAGEAVTMITGVDLAYQNLDDKRPDGFESGPNDEASDENVEMDQDLMLPWPNAGLIATWWDKHQGEFQNGVRYLLGKPIREEWMWEVLRVGRQRQRSAAALELAIMRPGEPLFEVRAPGFRQQEMLQRLTASDNR